MFDLNLNQGFKDGSVQSRFRYLTYRNLVWNLTSSKNEHFAEISEWKWVEYFCISLESKFQRNQIAIWINFGGFRIWWRIGKENKNCWIDNWICCGGRCCGSCRSFCCGGTCCCSCGCCSGRGCGRGCIAIPVVTWTAVGTTFHTWTVFDAFFVFFSTSNDTRGISETSVETITKLNGKTVFTSMPVIIVFNIVALKNIWNTTYNYMIKYVLVCTSLYS